jgi:predicted DNA-binding transcriptional regulator AlpA
MVNDPMTPNLTEDLEALRKEMNVLRDLIAQLISESTPSRHTPGPDDLVDAQYVADRLGISKSAVLHGKAGTADIPRHRQGRLVRFRRADVDAFLRSRAEQTKSPKERAIRLITRRKKIA